MTPTTQGHCADLRRAIMTNMHIVRRSLESFEILRVLFQEVLGRVAQPPIAAPGLVVR